MVSIHSSSIDAEEVDLSGLVESVVDSDEEDLVECLDYLTVRDAVRDCLEKDPCERTEEDIETLLEFTQGLKAFTNITLAVRRALCAVMVFAVVDKSGTIVMSDGEELDSWSVLINGHVEIDYSNGDKDVLHMGDSFGILPIMDKLYHRGIMRTKCDDCQFVCIRQTDYYRIQHQGEENIRRYKDDGGEVVLVTEMRQLCCSDLSAHNTKRRQIVIRGTFEKLLLQLIEENSMIDPTYVEDFLLTYRIFTQKPQDITQKLLQWFDRAESDTVLGTTGRKQEIRDRVTRVVLLWVNNHFTDFESHYEMMDFLEVFESFLERKNMLSQLRLLHIACSAKARLCTVTLTRSSRDEALNFQIVGGCDFLADCGKGIFISQVVYGTKAQDVGLKRGDQVIEVNGQLFDNISNKRAMETLFGSTHLSITVKSNLFAFKEVVRAIELERIFRECSTPVGVRSPRRICANDNTEHFGNRSNIVRLNCVDTLQSKSLETFEQADYCHNATQRSRLNNSSAVIFSSDFVSNILQSGLAVPKFDGTSSLNGGELSITGKATGGLMMLGPKRRIQKALMKINLLQRYAVGTSITQTKPPPDQQLSDTSDYPDHVNNTPVLADDTLKLKSTNASVSSLYSSQSLLNLTSICFEDNPSATPTQRHSATATASLNVAATIQDYPENVLKVYKADQTCKYLLIDKETTAHKVVALALQEFCIHDSVSNFSLCEVSVSEGGMVKQKRLPEHLKNLAERIGLSARYYIKINGITETLVPDEFAMELARESTVYFLQLNAFELAVQLTLEDLIIFRQIEPTEYVDDLFELDSKYGLPMLTKFASLVNLEMFWVVNEVCSEHNTVKRMKIIKQFIKIARHCKELYNFNSMFAIVSGLGHASVSRLRQSWEKLPSKYQRLFLDLQDLMDPSRNMSKYRQLVSTELLSQHPIIPFYPVVKKDLTFTHLGNDTYVENLINFEKLRMIAKEVRILSRMCSSSYDLLDMIENKAGQPPSSAMLLLNQMSGTNVNHHQQQNSCGVASEQGTIKRRKKSTAAPNPKKMFEEAQMVRRVKSYLKNMKIINDEEVLHKLSLECEPALTSTHFVANPASFTTNFSRSSADQISINSQTSTSSTPISSLSFRKRNPSPTLSNTSSTSSGDRRNMSNSTFPQLATASPKTVKNMLSLTHTTQFGAYQSRHASIALPLNSQNVFSTHDFGAVGGCLTPISPASPGSHRHLSSSSTVQGNGRYFSGRSIHERSHSDTPTLLPSVDFSSAFSKSPLQICTISGSVTSSDSGQCSYTHHAGTSICSASEGASQLIKNRAGTQYGSSKMPSNSSFCMPTTSSKAEQQNMVLPTIQKKRRHSTIHDILSTGPTLVGNTHTTGLPLKGPRNPPSYTIASHMERLQRLGRAHSLEGVTTSISTFCHNKTEYDYDGNDEMSAI